MEFKFTDNATKRITTLGILGALGAILMTYIQVPYPPLAFLKIEFSDVVVLIAFVLFGWKEAAFLGLLKAAINALVWGLVGPYGIGQIAAFIASMTYVAGMYLAIKLTIQNKQWLTMILTVSLVTIVMVIANFFFVTPLYVGMSFTEAVSLLTPGSFGFNVSGGYTAAILIAYVPFNLIKGILIMTIFFIIKKALFTYLEIEQV
ncbi:ECF transporter S component [Liberiplasma polymorphum]|uniref:ECF transporter S component n=1 Tax=Liberiplasma polymorphum TaxID=3374570 RepID=UPI003772A90E